jgi:hypothetical protein
MPITIDYGPRAQTLGQAGAGAGYQNSAYEKLRSLMDMWSQIEEAKKQREFQTSERLGSQEFAATQADKDRALKERELQLAREKAMTDAAIAAYSATKWHWVGGPGRSLSQAPLGKVPTWQDAIDPKWTAWRG